MITWCFIFLNRFYLHKEVIPKGGLFFLFVLKIVLFPSFYAFVYGVCLKF